MSVIGTGPVCAKAAGVSMPGTRSTIGAPGLKPSLVLMLGRVDVDAGCVGRRRGRVQVEAPAGRRSTGRASCSSRSGTGTGTPRRAGVIGVAAVGGVEVDADRVRAVAAGRVALHRGLRPTELAARAGLRGGDELGRDAALDQALAVVVERDLELLALTRLQLRLRLARHLRAVASLDDGDREASTAARGGLDRDLHLALVDQPGLRHTGELHLDRLTLGGGGPRARRPPSPSRRSPRRRSDGHADVRVRWSPRSLSSSVDGVGNLSTLRREYRSGFVSRMGMGVRPAHGTITIADRDRDRVGDFRQLRDRNRVHPDRPRAAHLAAHQRGQDQPGLAN